MKYIFKNLKSLWRNHTFFAALTACSIAVSTMIVLFSYGLYRHYRIVLDSGRSEEKDIYAVFGDENRISDVTKKEMDECLRRIQTAFADIGDSGNTVAVVAIDLMVDGMEFSTRMELDETGVKAPQTFFKNIKNGNYTVCEGWTTKDEREGKPVAIVYDYKNVTGHGGSEEHPILDKILQEDGSLVIAGKKYEVIGEQTLGIDGAIVPYSTLPEDALVQNFYFMTGETMTAVTAQIICDSLYSVLGNRVNIDFAPDLSQDEIGLYRTSVCLVALLAAVGSFNFLNLYLYILETRKRKHTVFRLCGMTRRQAVFTEFWECMVLVLPIFLAVCLIYHKLLLPVLQPHFVYLKNAYTAKDYLLLGAVYIFVSMAAGFILLAGKHRHSGAIGQEG